VNRRIPSAIKVPVREIWLRRNPVARKKVREGLAEAAEGRVRNLGSFAKHADEEIE